MAETTPQQLLLHAVDAMPAEDRERVLVWLLDRSFSASELPGMAGMSAAVRRELVESMPTLAPPGNESLLSRSLAGARRGDHQVGADPATHRTARSPARTVLRARVLDGDRGPRPGRAIPGGADREVAAVACQAQD